MGRVNDGDAGVTAGDVSALIFWTTIIVYLAVGIWMTALGWSTRAGLVTGAISFVPLLWQVSFTESEAPGFVLLLLLMLPVPLILITVGTGAAIRRLARRMIAARVNRTNP